MSNPLRRAASWFVQSEDPAGLLYGAIISAAVLEGAGDHTDDTRGIVFVTASVLVIYWLAHVYIYATSRQLRGDATSLPRRLASSAWHEASVLNGGVPAIIVYVAATAAGADKLLARTITMIFTVLLLMLVGYLSTRESGRTGRLAAIDTVAAGMLGILIIAANSLLH